MRVACASSILCVELHKQRTTYNDAMNAKVLIGVLQTIAK